MTIPEILSDEGLRRREFPVVERKVFLAHAGDSPLPRRVSDAVADYARQCATGNQGEFLWPRVMTAARRQISQLLHSDEDEVAFVGPTSLGLSILASGLKFRRGENILVYLDDFPSNVYPWMALADQGVEVRLLNIRELGVIRPKDIIGQVDENTRLVALSSCHFISGYRLDHETIGAFLRKRGILFCLDAIQTLGAFPTTVEQVDMLTADSHKWLLGPCAAGILYVRKEIQERINPPLHGWHNVRCPDHVTQEQLTWRSGAKKFEVGTQNLLGLVGLMKAVELLMEVGIENIAAELLRKRAWLAGAIQARSYQVLLANEPAANLSGITTFFKPDTNMAGLHARLSEAGVVSTLRTDRKGQRYIRFSPHFYNTDAELQSAVELL